MKKTGDFVLPGEKIAVIEEYLPGDGTFKDGGSVVSSVAGTVVVDVKEKRISVIPTKKPVIPNKGDLVIGSLKRIRKQIANVLIVKIGEEYIHPPFSGQIHISNVAEEYTESMHDAFSPGDIVRARIRNVEVNPSQLSTQGSDLGVLKSHCKICGEIMVKSKKRNTLFCPACEGYEKRKVAGDYGLENLSS